MNSYGRVASESVEFGGNYFAESTLLGLDICVTFENMVMKNMEISFLFFVTRMGPVGGYDTIFVISRSRAFGPYECRFLKVGCSHFFISIVSPTRKRSLQLRRIINQCPPLPFSRNSTDLDATQPQLFESILRTFTAFL